jgi:molybdenum cofactor guanylyltransferase
VALAHHALQRLQPQVARTMINANRHLEQYAAFGAPVWPDELPDYAGPLAGFVTALRHCTTAYLVTVPCDCPLFPTDLVARLSEALERDAADIAMAQAPEPGPDGRPVMRAQPVFCLMAARVLSGLERFLGAGGRKIDAWTALNKTVLVPLDSAQAFFNVNTVAELQALQP